MRLTRVIAAVATGGLALPWVLAAAASSAAPAGPGPGRTTLEVFAAASLSEAFTEVGHQLEQQRPGLVVRLNFAGSQQLATQIEQGASADVFASADERWMAYARERGFLSGEPVTFARNRM